MTTEALYKRSRSGRTFFRRSNTACVRGSGAPDEPPDPLNPFLTNHTYNPFGCKSVLQTETRRPERLRNYRIGCLGVSGNWEETPQFAREAVGGFPYPI